MPKYRQPYLSKRGISIKFVLPSKYADRLRIHQSNSGLSIHGTAKQLLVDTLSYPKYSKFIEIMKLIKEFEASCLE